MSNPLVPLPGLVYSLGKEANAAAELYANLTGRFHRPCEDPDALSAGCDDVIVGLTGILTPELMHRAFVRGDTRRAPGLICAPTAEELLAVCQRQASKLVRGPKKPLRRIFLFPALDFAVIYRGSDLFVGGTVSADVLVPLLSSGADMLVIFTHSGGLDIRLSWKLFGCPYPSPAEKAELMPACQTLGRCLRALTMSPDAAWDAGLLVPLTAIRADILVIVSCNVVRLVDGIMDPAYGVGATLLRQADFGVLVTTWRAESHLNFGLYCNAFLNDLASGTSVGRAVASFNGSEYARKFGANLCVVGDPCYALPSGLEFPELPLPPAGKGAHSAQPAKMHHSTRSQAVLLQDSIDAALPGAGRYFDANKGRSLAASLSSCSENEEAYKLEDLDGKLLDFLGSAPFVDRFRAPNHAIGLSEDGICPSCLSPARVHWRIFPDYQVRPWRIVSCARCDDSIMPESWQVSLDLSRLAETYVCVSGLPANATVLFSLTPMHALPDRPIFQHRDYARVASAEQKIIFQLPSPLSSLPLRCNILAAHHLEFAFVGFGLSALSDGTLTTARPALYQNQLQNL